ncbi:hypothetical protein H0H92_003443 [Tricholoma furcatifolium]|nr:hypothetical protein H0H92_003443 [Tricholoma furcatifolium]
MSSPPGWRGRGSRYGPKPQGSSISRQVGDKDILDGLSPTPLQTVTRLSQHTSDKKVEITNLQYAGSYNWVNKSTPTIIVPDQNGFRCPNGVLLPLIAAVNHMSDLDNETFDWSSVNLVTDRNNLRKLLRWISHPQGDINDFRIDVQLAGKTILFNRWENRYREQMSGKTFGFGFEKASTSAAAGCDEGVGHHRIVRYDMNGITLVVRFEVDACISAASPNPVSSPSRTAQDNLDDIINSLSSISISTAGATKPAPATSKFHDISIVCEGSIPVVPQSTIIELTTRSTKNAPNLDWKESYPQLFLSQTGHHFLGVHERGLFYRVDKRKLESPELREAASLEKFQEDLKKLRHLLDVIREIVAEHGERGRLSLVCRAGTLKVYERTSQASCLPDDVLKLFDV